MPKKQKTSNIRPSPTRRRNAVPPTFLSAVLQGEREIGALLSRHRERTRIFRESCERLASCELLLLFRPSQETRDAAEVERMNITLLGEGLHHAKETYHGASAKMFRIFQEG